MSLFEDEGDLIQLNPIYTPNIFCCPHCGLSSSLTQGTQLVRLQKTSDSITLFCRTLGIHSLLAFPNVSTIKNIILVLPLLETLTFNFSTGNVSLLLTGSNGHIIAEQDISSSADIWNATVVYQLIKDNTLVRRKLSQLFSALWNTSLPFSVKELTPDDFITLTRFQGYPRSFYDAIPYAPDKHTLDESFMSIAPKLHNIKLLPTLYETFGLPAMKSIRKLFFCNPGFFFYLPTASSIWHALKDPNVYRALFRLPEIYDILATFHHYPISIEFFHDYYNEKGPKSLMLLIQSNNWPALQAYSLFYAAMSPSAKNNARNTWRGHCLPTQQFPSHSTPMQTDARITPCTVNGYRFAWLRTKKDYQKAAKELNNCLNERSARDNPVIGVSLGSSLCAAIEVKDDTIRQAYARDNTPIIEYSPKLYDAYQKWMQKFSLHPAYFLSEYDLDDEIEF